MSTKHLTRSLLALALAGGGLAVASPAVADVAPGQACAGVADCRTVASVDVDGDGLFDDVALAPGSSPDTAQVLVSTATGQLATYEVPIDTYADESYGVENYGVDPWYGAAQIDGRPGDDLVFTSSVGAHATFSTVLSFTDGYLVELPAPGSPVDADPGLTQWVVDGSVSSNVGVTVETPGTVTVRSAVTDWEPTENPVYDASEQTWTFTDGTWVPAGPEVTSNPPVGSPLPQGFSGWHAVGLPVH